MIEETIQKRKLSLLELEAGFGDGEEADFVDLGEALEFAGADGPFGGKGVAGVNVASRYVAFARPGVHGFAAFLKDRAKVDERAERNEPGFFAEFAFGGDEQVFAFVGLALGDGPMAIVFLGEERSARVCEENIGHAVAEAVEEEASGDARAARAHATTVSVQRLRKSP